MVSVAHGGIMKEDKYEWVYKYAGIVVFILVIIWNVAIALGGHK